MVIGSSDGHFVSRADASGNSTAGQHLRRHPRAVQRRRATVSTRGMAARTPIFISRYEFYFRIQKIAFFNSGDYVDRGPNSVEVICLVLACKVAFKNDFFILRGNHESSSINRVYGFWDELCGRYDKSLWASFNVRYPISFSRFQTHRFFRPASIVCPWRR